jgi:hypothetical protein
VAERTFRGATTVLELVLDDGPALRAEVPSAGAPERGALLRVRIDPDAVVAVDP